MSVRARLDRLDSVLGRGDQCRFCGKAHVRDLAQIVAAVYSERVLCDCSLCGCHWSFDETVEHYRWHKRHSQKEISRARPWTD